MTSRRSHSHPRDRDSGAPGRRHRSVTRTGKTVSVIVLCDRRSRLLRGTRNTRGARRLPKATYAQLERASNRVANGLTSFGLERQDHVAFIGKNSVFCVELLIGAAKAGMVLTIANWRLHPSELDYVLRDSEAKIVFVAEDLRDTLPSPLPKSVREVVVVGDGEASWTSWPDAQVNAPRCHASCSRRRRVAALHLGTTGRPKGAMLTNAAIAATIPDTADVWQLDETQSSCAFSRCSTSPGSERPSAHCGGEGA